MVSKKDVAAAFKAAAKALGVRGKELGDLLSTLSKLSEAELDFFPRCDDNEADNEAIIEFARSRRISGAAAGLGKESATGADAAAGLGPQSAAAAGAAAGPYKDVIGAMNNASLEEAMFPSSLNCIAFTLYNGSRLATTLVSHAKALGFRGEVRHISVSRSDFKLLLSAAAGESSGQPLASFARWMTEQVPVYRHVAEAEVGAACVVVTSKLSNPRTSDRDLLDLYRLGKLSVRVTSGLQLELERAAKAAEEEERSSRHSLGKESSSSAQE